MCKGGGDPGPPVDVSMYQETPTGTALLYLSLARLDNLYRPEFQDRSIPDPQPPDLLNPLADPQRDPERTLDLEERTAEPPSVTVPDLDI